MPWYEDIGRTIGQGLGGFIGLAGNIFGNVRAARDSRRHDVRMWEMQQEYNTPQNQMKRLQDAGINPHLAFSKGISNVAPQQPKSTELRINAGLQQHAQYQQLQNLKAQNDLMRAQAQKTYAEAEVAEGTKSSNIRLKELEEMTQQIRFTQKRYGVESADPMLKVLFQHLDQKTMARYNHETGKYDQPQLSEEQVRNIMSGIVITKEVARLLTALGFGKLLSKKPVINKNFNTTNRTYRYQY